MVTYLNSHINEVLRTDGLLYGRKSQTLYARLTLVKGDIKIIVTLHNWSVFA